MNANEMRWKLIPVGE
jgi:hypothetical protein